MSSLDYAVAAVCASVWAAVVGGLLVQRRHREEVRRLEAEHQASDERWSVRYGEAMAMVSAVARIPDCAAPEIKQMCEDILRRHEVSVTLQRVDRTGDAAAPPDGPVILH